MLVKRHIGPFGQLAAIDGKPWGRHSDQKVGGSNPSERGAYIEVTPEGAPKVKRRRLAGVGTFTPGGRLTALVEDAARESLDLMEGDRTYPIWAFLLGSGLRIGELVSLRWPNVDLKRRQVHVVEFVTSGPYRHAGT